MSKNQPFTLAELKAIRKRKLYEKEWYTLRSIFGNTWAYFYILLGAREAGKYRLEGRDYVFKDGDVALFRFNV